MSKKGAARLGAIAWNSRAAKAGRARARGRVPDEKQRATVESRYWSKVVHDLTP